MDKQDKGEASKNLSFYIENKVKQSEQNINSALYPKPQGDDANSYQLTQNNKTNTMTDANNSFSLTGNLNSNNNKKYLSSNKLSSSLDSSYKQGEEQSQQLKSLGNNSSAITNQSNAWDKNTRQDQNELPDISTLGHYSNNTNPNQTVIPENKQISMISTRPTLSQWLKDVNTKPMTMNGTNMNGQERIKALKDGQSIVINVEDTDIPQESNANEHLHNWGKEEVDKYGNLIEKYANQYNLDPNMAKAILYTEASDYHKYGLDSIADKLGVSTSVRPMNIQGKTWGNFQGQRYDVKNPEQNIELGVRILKAIYDAVPDKDVTKIATLWNGTGLRNINEYGKKAQEYYLNQSWKD